ncbi:N-acetylmuramidase family protein [Sphingomonas alpina]|uniref:N-acetylmuramidase family protein n=1 Tax=Sphingomonas alpina TaxID=653931 RepID=A0A7H0LLW0_9SPHN|nr:N-acetylmuramidase family protein [Sphingomonas alpina]QNQ10663.1 N-acetylmuramidase family protein [Sphingomonas alpina]
MTIPYPAALGAIRTGSTSQLRQVFEALTVAESVELGTFIGPQRLRAITVYPAMVTAFRPLPEPIDTVAILSEIGRQAFNDPAGLLLPLRPDPALVEQVRLALLDVERRRRVGPLLTMPTDVTATLPTPTGIPPALTEADYSTAATQQNVEVAAIKAVAVVESGGRSGFDSQGRPKILFEAHHFSGHSGNRFNTTHPHLSVPARQWRTASNYYGWDQYQRLREAMVLDVDAALKSASWGKFQVLGSNHSGWPNVRSFVEAMYVSEANHLRSFVAFCNDNNLMGFVRTKDWLSFALGYNGQSQQGYDQRMATAYLAAGGTPPAPRARR